MLTPVAERQFLELITELESFAKQQPISSGLNIFEAAGLSRQEFRHSNFLEFLLNPRSPLGIGDAFVRRLLKKAIERIAISPPIGALDLALADFSDALIRREWREIDLLIESKANRLIVIIENKIDAIESKGQLSKYQKTIEAEYPGERKLYCYLTPEGDPPTNDDWTILSYSDVVKSLIDASRDAASSLPVESKILIDHYIQLLIRRNIVTDQDLVDACRRIYLQHKGALDLIIRYGETNAFDAAAATFFAAHSDVERISTRSGNAVTFLPREFLSVVPEISGLSWQGQSRPFVFWFNRYGDRIGLVFEVGPFSTKEHDRVKLARSLLEHFGNKSQISPKYTRVFSDYRKLSDEDAQDAGTLAKIMEDVFKSSRHHFDPVMQILQNFFGI